MIHVAVTDLHNLACPFIRYLIGDYATAREAVPCACGRPLPRFGPIEGRVTETMRDSAGNPVEGSTCTTTPGSFRWYHVRGVKVSIELVAEMPLTKAGKLRRVIVEQTAPSEHRNAG